ncbi:D-alanyl-D-alanine carboxypeptidase family protein [Snodgrassella gandavensis]|uniref:D-alanyl-D-alanine carboxypeptidase family protein n=1 Tax=Snodgrassella gandavensis TaxID=2946698 RepID=UPI001EF63BDF|nr:D-alanyl-D-alanine carboxypeptidase family protein [Snodgrassella gandavensis]
MMRNFFRWFYTALLMGVLPLAQAVSLPEINAAAYVVADEQSGMILASRDKDARIEPAALTKLMTAYLVFDALHSGKLKAQQPLKISTAGWHTDGSRMFLQQGVAVNVETVVQGMLVVSANDAAITLAEAVSGGEKAFVRRMNAEAQKMGLENTHFVNCTGLPAEGQYSSVGDLLLLAQALVRDFPQYQGWFAKKSFSYNGITQLNRNLLLFRDDQVDGLAVGYTINGGYNLAVSSKRNERRVIAVLVGADSSEARAAEGSKLLSWALTSFNTARVYPASHKVADIAVYKGAYGKVAVGFLRDAYVTLPSNGTQQLSIELEAVQPVVAPVRKGQGMGTLKLLLGKQVVAQQDVVALDDVGEAGWFSRWLDAVSLWWRSLFS